MDKQNNEGTYLTEIERHYNEKLLPYIQDAEHTMEALESDYEVAIWVAELLMKLDDKKAV